MPGKDQGRKTGSPLTRSEAAAIFQRFARAELTGGEESGLIRRLRVGQDVAVPLLLERLQQGTGLEQDIAGYLVAAVGGQATKEALVRIVQDPQASTRARAAAIAGLQNLGEPADLEALLSGVKDRDHFTRDAMETVLATVSSDETTLHVMALDIEKMPVAERKNMLQALGLYGDRRALRLLVPLLYAREAATTLAAIEALETLGATEVVPDLAGLSQGCPRPEVRSRAKAACGKLAVEAVSVPEGDAPQGRISRWPVQELPLYKALVSTIDGDGGQCLLVGRKQRDGRLKDLGVMLNDHQGVKDCLAPGLLTAREWGKIVSEMEKSAGLSWVEVGLPRCRRVLAEARATNIRRRRKLPVELAIWSGLLQDGPEAARLWSDEEPEEIAAGPGPSPQAIQRSGELLELPEFSTWRFGPEAVGEHCVAAFAAMGSGRGSKAKNAKMLQSALDDMVHAAMKPGYCALLQGRLRRQAWLLRKLGREDHCLLAMAAASALEGKGDLPLEKQPFIRQMALKTLIDAAFLAKDAQPVPLAGRGDGPESAPADRRRAGGTYRLRVSLKGYRGISRDIEIKGSQTLHKLHEAIFAAFDRYDEHLYAFYLSNKAYDESSEYESPDADERTGKDASRARLDSLGLRPRQKFLYVFDFGDDWQHTVEVLDITEEVPRGRYPRVVAKRGDSPPQYPDVSPE